MASPSSLPQPPGLKRRRYLPVLFLLSSYYGVVAALSSSTSSSPSASASSSSNSNSSKSPPEIYYLQRYHPERTPSETLQYLSEQCIKLGVDTFDVYGDFGTYGNVKSSTTTTKRSSKSSRIKPSTSSSAVASSSTPPSSSSSSYLRKFEQIVANEFQKEDAVFMPSGVMAQSIALLIHSKKTKSTTRSKEDRPPDNKNEANNFFACHYTSHLLLHEQDGYRELCNMIPIVLGKDDNNELDNKDSTSSIHCPPLGVSHVQSSMKDNEVWKNGQVSTLILELPHRELGGKLTPYNDILEMSKLLKKHNVAFHCDGARIFEAYAGYTTSNDNKSSSSPLTTAPPKSMSELVKPFDSIYISFYKGLGGISGAMLLGTTEFCNEARIWLRRFGGNLYTLLPYVISGWSGYQTYYEYPEENKERLLLKQQRQLNDNGSINQDDERILTFGEKKNKLTRIVTAITESAELAAADASSSSSSRSPVITFDPPIPEVNMIHMYFRASLDDCNRIRDDIQNKFGIRLFERIRSLDPTSSASTTTMLESEKRAIRAGYQCKLELTIGQSNGCIPDDIFIKGWTEFCNSF